MTIFLTGATGLLGHSLARAFLKKQWKVHVTAHDRTPKLEGLRIHYMDLSLRGKVAEGIKNVRPDAIVNAAALSMPAACQKNPALSRSLNLSLPVELATVATDVAARYIHFSTDMVFDGKTGNYREDDPTKPTNLYGEHKLRSEAGVAANHPGPSIIRLPLLMGNSPAGTRSVHEAHWKAWKAGKITSLFEDEWRQPASVTNVAALTVELIETPSIQGLFHWAGASRHNRWEMGMMIAERLGVPENLLRRSLAGNHPDFADRPLDLTMDCSKIKARVKTEPAPFTHQLTEIKIPGP